MSCEPTLMNTSLPRPSKSALSPAAERHIALYSQSHQTRPNVLLHCAGIPLFMVSSLGLLSRLPRRRPPRPSRFCPDQAWMAITLSGIWYVSLDKRFGMATSASMIVAHAIGRRLPRSMLRLLFAGGIVAH